MTPQQDHSESEASLHAAVNPDEPLLQAILDMLETVLQQDFQAYKTSTLWRRIQHRQTLHGLDSVAAYLDFLQAHPAELPRLAHDMLIGVTRFFRDPEAFEVLKQEILPELIHRAGKGLRIWVPACASGEEAYSIAMLVQETLQEMKLRLPVVIFATDINALAVQQAAKGFFPLSIQQELSNERLSNFFLQTSEGFQVLPALRESLVFSTHNLLKDPPFSQVDLLCCRNALIYLKPQYQNRLINLFSYAIREGGYLLLGPSESSFEHPGFVSHNSRWKIYTNREPSLAPGAWPISLNSRTQLSQQGQPGRRLPPSLASQRLQEHLSQYLMQHQMPPSFICRENLELLYTTGNLDSFLQLPRGQINLNILNMLPPNVASSVNIAVQKLLQTRESVRLSSLCFELEGQVRRAALHFALLNLPAVSEETLVHIQLEPEATDSTDSPLQQPLELDLSQASREKLALLEEELRLHKAHLQVTVSELESSNAELQAANEELQSTNEELYTVNTEYQAKVEELSIANDDLNNLLHSTDIATLFLDAELKIRRFTEAIHRIMNLLPQDIGRHISHFRSKIRYEKFLQDIEAVASSHQPCERQIQDAQDNWFIMRIHPFKTHYEQVKGVVLTFIDISALVKTQHALQSSEHQLSQTQQLYDLIAHNIQDVVCLFSLDFSLQYLSPSVQDLLGQSPEAFQNCSFLDLVHPEDRERVDGLLRRQLTVAAGITFTCRLNQVQGERWVETSLRLVRHAPDQPDQLLASLRDMTQRHQTEQRLRQSEGNLKAIFQSTTEAFLLVDRDLCLLALNPQAEAWLALQGASGFQPGSALTALGSAVQAEALQDKLLPVLQGQAIDYEENYADAGGERWFHVSCTPVYDPAEQGRVSGICLAAHEITEARRSEQRLLDYAQRLSGVLESITDAFIALDPNWIITYLNRQTEALLGYSREQLLGRALPEVFPGFEETHVKQILEQARELQQPAQLEIFSKQYRIWLELNIFPAHQTLSIFFRDITETRVYRAISELERVALKSYAAEEQSLPLILDQVLLAVEKLLPGVQCSILEARQGKLSNLSSPSLSADYLSAIEGAQIAEGNGSCGTAAWRREAVFSENLLQDPLWQAYQELIRPYPLQACWSFPIISTNQNLLGTFACYFAQPCLPQKQDQILAERVCSLLALLLESQQATVALAQSNERYQIVSQATNDVIWDWDLEQNRVIWNHALQTVLGHILSDASTPADFWYEHIHPEDRERVVTGIHAHIDGQYSHWQDEYRFACADGTYRDMLDRGYIIFDNEQKSVRMIGAMQDITERKQAEVALYELNWELQQQAEHLTVSNQHLEQFTYIVSHNLRSPVANLLGVCELLSDPSQALSPEAHQDMLQGLQSSAQRLDEVIRHMNQILHIQKGLSHQAYEWIELEALLQDVLASYATQIQSAQALIQIDLQIDKMHAIRPYLHSILDNLISNALKYRHPQRPLQLQIQARKLEREMCIEVRDNGLGIPETAQKHLFGMYKRFHSHVEGKGLGLYMSKVQAESLGGRLLLYSAQEQAEGAHFALFVPEPSASVQT